MSLSLLLDNDVLIKLACYSLLDQIKVPDDRDGSTGVLGSAPFVVRKRLARPGTACDSESALLSFHHFLSTVTVLEPTDAELALASVIEETATLLGLELDGGESQLCAIAVSRMSPLVLTGDKRAIGGAEKLLYEMSELDSLVGRIVCLEQAVMGIATRIGVSATRLMICAEPKVDRSLSICFGCSLGERSEISLEGLASYVRDARRQAPALLYSREMM